MTQVKATSERVALTPENIKTIKKAVRCPAKLVKSSIEKEFLQETKARLERFGDGIYMTEKQVSWLEKIAGRMDGQGGAAKPKSKPEAVPAGIEDLGDEDLPDFNDLAGE